MQRATRNDSIASNCAAELISPHKKTKKLRKENRKEESWFADSCQAFLEKEKKRKTCWTPSTPFRTYRGPSGFLEHGSSPKSDWAGPGPLLERGNVKARGHL